MLAFAAVSNKDKVGLLLFSDHVEKYIPPAKGRSHVLRIIRELLTYRPRPSGTDLAPPLETVGRVLKRKATVFLVSDFWAGDFSRSCGRWGAVTTAWPCGCATRANAELPAVGLVTWRDAETGQEVLVDTDAAAVRTQLPSVWRGTTDGLERGLRQAGVDLVDVDLTGSYVEPLHRFFAARVGRRVVGGVRVIAAVVVLLALLGVTSAGAQLPEAAIAPADTAVARFAWTGDGPTPAAIGVWPEEARFGQRVVVMLDHPLGTDPPPLDSLRVDVAWLDRAPAGAAAELPLPPPEGPRQLAHFRVYREGPWRAAWQKGPGRNGATGGRPRR